MRKKYEQKAIKTYCKYLKSIQEEIELKKIECQRENPNRYGRNIKLQD